MTAEEFQRDDVVCTSCGTPKARGEFHPDPRNVNGLEGRCKMCQREQRRKWRRNRPAVYNAQMRRYYRKHGSLPIDEAPLPSQRARWTDEDDRLVLAAETTDAELAKVLHRSAMAIVVRRYRLKRGLRVVREDTA